jgi:hypothetical protein
VKLDWYNRSDIRKHYEDTLGVAVIQKDSLDLDYIRRWCEQQSTGEILDDLLAEAAKPGT